MNISFRPIQDEDFPQLYKWLNTDFIIQWYSKKERSYNSIKNQYVKYITGEEPTQAYIIQIDNVDIGMIKTYFYSDYMGDGYFDLLEADETSVGVDLFIGHKEYVHKGFGVKILKAFLNEYVFTNADIKNCIITPEPDNIIAIKVYEKVGFKWYKTIKLLNGNSEYLMKLDNNY